MFHGLNNDFLYCAYKIETTFKDDQNTIKNAQGTAFFVKNKRGDLCLITNRHVVDIRYLDKNSQYIRFRLTTMRLRGKGKEQASMMPDLEQYYLVVDFDKAIYHSNRENDIACIISPRVISLTSTDNPANVTIEYFIPYNFIATQEDYRTNLSICDFVAFPGFPEWHDRRGNRPILRVGTLASDPRYDYSSKEEYQGAQVAYEAFSFGGSSGSPIFAVQKGLRPGAGLSFSGFRDLLFIGINAGHLPVAGSYGQHSGISYFYKSTAILEIIEGNG